MNFLFFDLIVTLFLYPIISQQLSFTDLNYSLKLLPPINCLIMEVAGISLSGTGVK